MSIHLAMATPRRALEGDEPHRVLEFAVRSVETGIATALVTLVEVEGGAAKGLGSQMSVAEDGLFCGYISGGCAEAIIAAEVQTILKMRRDQTLRIGKGSRFFDFALPCGGSLLLAIHVLRDAVALNETLLALRQRRPATLSYCSGRQILEFHPFHRKTGWVDNVFWNAYRPTIRLAISGNTIEARMTARVAEASGLDVWIVDTVEPMRDHMIDQDTAVALLHHDLESELVLLEAALKAQPFYIGALGSTRTHGKRTDLLAHRGWSREAIGRIKAPIGIFGKTRDASTLALSVVADIACSRQSQQQT